MREQCDKVSLKKKQDLRLSMLSVGENRVVCTRDDFFQMSSDVISEVVLHVCVSQPFVVCCLEEQETTIPR